MWPDHYLDAKVIVRIGYPDRAVPRVVYAMDRWALAWAWAYLESLQPAG